MASTSVSRDGRMMTGGLCSFGLSASIRALFASHIGVETDVAVRFDFAVNALDLDVETGKRIETRFEHLEIVDHGLRSLGDPLARHDRCDAGWIDHEGRRRDTASDLVDGKILDIVAHQA